MGNENQVLLMNMTQSPGLECKNEGGNVQYTSNDKGSEEGNGTRNDSSTTRGGPKDTRGGGTATCDNLDSLNLESPFGKHRTPGNVNQDERISIMVAGLQSDGMVKRIKEELTRTGTRAINNMYEPSEESEHTQCWKCPLCKEIEGQRINQFGVCRNKDCLGVRTEHSYRSRAEEEVRKAETALIGQKYSLEEGKKTRVFWSDGSGQDLMKNGTLTTGWGLVECQQDTGARRINLNKGDEEVEGKK